MSNCQKTEIQDIQTTENLYADGYFLDSYYCPQGFEHNSSARPDIRWAISALDKESAGFPYD